jgi:soluble lytic murein transglycosylase-like protein
MRNRLHSALMATVIATFLSFTPHVRAQTGIVATKDDEGRTVFINNDVPSSTSKRRSASAPVAQRNSLVYWSAKERRYKPVPKTYARAARSAAADVDQLLNQGSSDNSEGQTIGFYRGRPYTQRQIDAAIEQAAARHNVDPNLVRSVVKVESNFNPNAVSRKGAMGLMQLMPGTARQLKVTNPFDPEQNIDAGVRHLKSLMESYGGDVRLSLAAYNAGMGAVARSGGVPRYSETRKYVRRITDLYYGNESSRILGNPVHDPVRVERDSRGVLYISNVD